MISIMRRDSFTHASVQRAIKNAYRKSTLATGKDESMNKWTMTTMGRTYNTDIRYQPPEESTDAEQRAE
jgi:hypothetical protein